MILTHIKLLNLFVATLILCCLITSVIGGKLSTIEAKDNNTDLIKSNKTDVKIIEVAAREKGMKNKSSVEDDDGEDDDDDDDDDDDEVKDDAADDESETAEKNAIQPAADTSLSIWGIVRGLWNWIKEDISGNLFGDDVGEAPVVGEGRTFGKIRRLQMALIPIMFKFGVLSAMIGFLVAVSVKTLFLVKVLVVMNLLALLAKFFTFKSNYGHVEHFSSPPAPMWSPPYIAPGWHSAPEEHHLNKEIHLHVHGGQLPQPQASSYSYGSGTTGQTHGWEKRSDPYSAYDNIALQDQKNELMANELPHTANSNSVGNQGQHYGRSFPANHRIF